MGFMLFCLIIPAHAALTPEELVNKLNEKFSRVKDAQADIVLDMGLQIFGCGGMQNKRGRFWFKAPDKIKIILGRDVYFIRGNFIRKIDGEGRRFYVRLLHTPDFSPGFNPRLITHNFNLKIIGETTGEVVMEGLPKPGVLKNVKKVTFHIDPKENLLLSLDISISQGIRGRAVIKYEKIEGLWVPVGTYGKSALEINGGFLAGFLFNLKGENVKINTGLSDRLFDPGF
jgi:hypothetical protein